MARDCVTHHHACDCREARFREIEAERDALKQRVRDLEAVIEIKPGDPQAIAMDFLRKSMYLTRKANDQCDALKREREALREALTELVAVVRGECPQLLNEDSGGDARLDMKIDAALSPAEPKENGDE